MYSQRNGVGLDYLVFKGFLIFKYQNKVKFGKRFVKMIKENIYYIKIVT